MFAPPFFQLFNNTHFMVRKIFIWDIEKHVSVLHGLFFALRLLCSIFLRVLAYRSQKKYTFPKVYLKYT